NGRTPMQWNNDLQAGFTNGTPWIPLASNYSNINVENALQDSDSIFYHYQKLIDLRKRYDVITYGDYELLFKDHPQIFAYTRTWKDEKLLVLNNFYGKDVTIDLELDKSIGQPEILLSNYP